MGWEKRGLKRIYYRKERFRDEAGRARVRSIYCGSGERGEKAAREDAERRAERVAHAQKAPQTLPNEEGKAAVRPITAEEIVARGVANWPDALKKTRGDLLRGMMDGGMVALALRFAGITDREMQQRGLACATGEVL